jgi:hypothetical protein
MNLRELVDHIHSGPAKLVLDKPLRVPRPTRRNSCDFDEFLQALHYRKTIRTVECESHLVLNITEDEWILLVKTLGSIKGLQNLRLSCRHGSRDFHLFQAITDAVKNARSLRTMKVHIYGHDDNFHPDSSAGLTALASALREHTALQEFNWFEFGSRREAAPRNLSLDPVLRALPACPHLRKVAIMTKYASDDALRNMLLLPSAIDLHLVLKTTENWLAVADEIRQGRCLVTNLHLGMLQSSSSKATEAVQAVANAIRRDCNLEHLHLQMEDGFTDEAGVALAEALTVNKTLRKINLSTTVPLSHPVWNKAAATLGAHAHVAFSTMMRVNTSLVLKLPPFETASTDRRLLESHKQMRIEQRLNKAGRGKLLASSQTTREQWVDALSELNSYNVDDSAAFQVGCLFSLLRLNPFVVCVS